MDINGNYIILRHSVRGPIRNLKESLNEPLTDEGIELAKHLGKVLSQYTTNPHSFIAAFSDVSRQQII